MNPLRDGAGRPIDYLRVSVTDRCNLRCRYCMPAEGVPLTPADQLLSFEELTRAIAVAQTLGIDRVRITGGEPLLRADLPTLIRSLRDLGIDNLALTTNGLLLHKHAAALADAGLTRVNVSLDSLRPERFDTITRFSLLKETWRGIDAAIDAGLAPIKINTVVLAGFNDDEVDDWVQLTRDRPLTVRFLELMPIGEGANARRLGGFHDLSATLNRLRDTYQLEPEAPDGRGPARYWRVPGAPGRLGFITPLSNPYCDTCSRFRLTARGGIRPCLAHDLEVEAGPAIRAGDDEAIAAAFRDAAARKPLGHHWRDGQATQTSMSTLGG